MEYFEAVEYSIIVNFFPDQKYLQVSRFFYQNDWTKIERSMPPKKSFLGCGFDDYADENSGNVVGGRESCVLNI